MESGIDRRRGLSQSRNSSTQREAITSVGTQQGKARHLIKGVGKIGLSTWEKNGPLPHTIYEIISSRIIVLNVKSKTMKVLVANLRI